MTEPQQRKPRRTYTDEFKDQLVQRYLNGKTKCDILKEYNISSDILDKWLMQANSAGSFKEKDNRTSEEEELIALRRRNKQLEIEVDILYPYGYRH